MTSTARCSYVDTWLNFFFPFHVILAQSKSNVHNVNFAFFVLCRNTANQRRNVIYCYIDVCYKPITILKLCGQTKVSYLKKISDILQLITKPSIFVQFTDNGSPRRAVQTPREVSKVPASTPETRDTAKYHADVGGAGRKGE